MRKAANDLAEHCASVRIVATVDDVDGEVGYTGVFRVGRGNIYAQQASVREWLQMMDKQVDLKAERDWKEADNKESENTENEGG